MRFQVDISARKEGAIGIHGTERRSYTIEVASRDDLNMAAIQAAYKEGGLEHVNIVRVRELDVADGLHNPSCDGTHCQTAVGEVRVYPIGGGGNLILCFHCWAHENRYRYDRGEDYNRANKLRPHDTLGHKEWPQVNWFTAKLYGAE